MSWANRAFGRLPARFDARVSLFTGSALPDPPDNICWFADIGAWGMMRNDEIGDCAWAAAGHAILQQSTYAGAPLLTTDEEVVANYAGCTGYDPADPSSDRGTFIQGQGGLLEYWATNGLKAGGAIVKPEGFVTCDPGDTKTIRQMIQIFGGVLAGFNLPEAAETDGYVWRSTGGALAGGHEVWVDGAEKIGEWTYYDLISWGTRFRCTEDFLRKQLEEVVGVLDTASIDARGVDGAGVPLEQLRADLASFRAA